MDRISLFKMSGLPDPFGIIVLIFSFILLLSPYLSGSDFGIFKIPAFAEGARKWLKIIGPIVFLLAVFFYLPVFPGTRPGLKESASSKGSASSKESVSSKESASSDPELKPLSNQGAASFFEGFAGGKLNSEWQVLVEDPTNWTLQTNPPSLQIVTQKGSIWAEAKNLKNQFVLNRELPKTNFDLIVKASFQVQGVGNALSVAIFRDDDNFIEIGYRGKSWATLLRVVHLTKEVGGQRDETVVEPPIGGGPDKAPVVFYLKIERAGNEFTGYYSFVENLPPENIDDIRWTRIGTKPWIDFSGKLSLWASNSEFDSPQTAARFDFVLIRDRKV